MPNAIFTQSRSNVYQNQTQGMVRQPGAGNPKLLTGAEVIAESVAGGTAVAADARNMTMAVTGTTAGLVMSDRSSDIEVPDFDAMDKQIDAQAASAKAEAPKTVVSPVSVTTAPGKEIKVISSPANPFVRKIHLDEVQQAATIKMAPANKTVIAQAQNQALSFADAKISVIPMPPPQTPAECQPFEMRINGRCVAAFSPQYQDQPTAIQPTTTIETPAPIPYTPESSGYWIGIYFSLAVVLIIAAYFFGVHRGKNSTVGLPNSYQ